MKIDELAKAFESLYKRKPAGAASAPGRVNLIGEHTDYNGGFVLPMAIERRTVALFAARDDSLVNFSSVQAGPYALSVHLDGPIVPAEMPPWANYTKGVIAAMREKGLKLRGADMLLASDVPLGGGLSSSASLEVATAVAMLEVAGLTGTVADRDLALLCQKAENVYAGAPCGIMDQSIAVMGRAGQALLLDCRDGATRHIPFNDPSLVLLVADTQVKHTIGDGGYPARRVQCQEAAVALGVALLREATLAQVEQAQAAGKLHGKQYVRARHVVTEIARTVEAVAVLEKGDYAAFGRLMYGSHASLRDDFEVSCPELDTIVEAAAKCEGVFGARMTGGGFGGCAIVLVRADRAADAEAAIVKAFESAFGRACPVFATRAADGAGRVRI